MEISDTELEIIKKQAATDAKLDDLDLVIPEIHSNLKTINKNINDMPGKIARCKVEIQTEITDHVQRHYITEAEMSAMERKIETKMHTEVQKVTDEVVKIASKVNRATWVVSGFVSAGTFIIYLVMETNVFSGIGQ